MSALYCCERAGPEHTEGLLALFESAGTGCFCNYWHFEGDKNAWLERCYVHTEQNRAALVERLSAPELCGVVALAQTGGALCGWLKLARATALPRLYQQRVYRNLPCFGAASGDRETTYTVGCCYVLETQRGHGVARALLSAAIEAVRAAGGSALEAFPRGAPAEGGGAAARSSEGGGAARSSEGGEAARSSEGGEAARSRQGGERLRPDEIWMGPESVFLQAGFAKVSDFRPYPVLRLHLR